MGLCAEDADWQVRRQGSNSKDPRDGKFSVGDTGAVVPATRGGFAPPGWCQTGRLGSTLLRAVPVEGRRLRIAAIHGWRTPGTSDPRWGSTARSRPSAESKERLPRVAGTGAGASFGSPVGGLVPYPAGNKFDANVTGQLVTRLPPSGWGPPTLDGKPFIAAPLWLVLLGWCGCCG